MIPFLGPILGLVGNIFGGVNDHFEGKRKIKQSQVDSTIALAKAKVEHVILTAQTGQAAEIDWDVQALKNAQNSWADEWFVILLSIPAVLSFCGTWGATVVYDGFTALNNAPDWYLGAFGIAVAASFGVRKFGNKMIDRIKGK
jgi:hypothetical protein